jgi:hypothetical protein
MVAFCKETDDLAVPKVGELYFLVYGPVVPGTDTLPAVPTMILCPRCGSPEFHSYRRPGKWQSVMASPVSAVRAASSLLQTR